MNEQELLNNLLQTAKQEKLDAEILPASETVPFDLLLVFLGHDQKQRERIIEITGKKQVLGQNSKDDYFHIQFAAKLPIKTQTSALFDTGSLLLYLNRFLDLPGFEMSESDATIHYRYVLMSTGMPDEKLFLSLLGLIGLYLTLYAELIEIVATGKKEFNDILEEILEAAT